MPDELDDSFLSDEKIKEMRYSVIIPVYNEEESLEPLLTELLQVMTPLKALYEIIFVDDCSDDQSSAILEKFKRNLPEIVQNVRLDKRSGQTYALKKGFSVMRGRVAITMDADLQNDPADIPKLLDKLKGDVVCVCGWRKSRQDTPLKAVFSKMGNVLQRLFTGMKIHDVSCTLRAYRVSVVNDIGLKWEGQHRFIPMSLSLQGYNVDEIISNHRLRKYGTTKYSHKRLLRVVKDFFKVLKTKGRG